MKTVLFWFRNDLRLDDNPALVKAIQSADRIVPIYIFEEKLFEKTALGFNRCGSFRWKFLLESVKSLEHELAALGAELWIASGKPEEIIPRICIEQNVRSVYCSHEVAPEEVHTELLLENQLVSIGVSFNSEWISTLISKSSLPFPVTRTPDIFTDFRKRVEKDAENAMPLEKVGSFNGVNRGEYCRYPQLDREQALADDRICYPFEGGIKPAIARLEEYFWKSNAIATYKETRNGLLGDNYSSKFSPWLSVGSISAARIASELERYEQTVVENESTYWLKFELLWRDFFRFTMAKAPMAFFRLRGSKKRITRDWSTDPLLFEKWRMGETGDDFVDANMKELLLTGWMSNRGRQNVASYLVHDLGIDWRWGATWFESQLIDYDVCSNWGNWAYVAGVGNDPRPFRKFNTIKQSEDYDKRKEYRRTWLERAVI